MAGTEVPKLSKQELRNILEAGWLERREKIKKRKEENAIACKDWIENKKFKQTQIQAPLRTALKPPLKPSPTKEST